MILTPIWNGKAIHSNEQPSCDKLTLNVTITITFFMGIVKVSFNIINPKDQTLSRTIEDAIVDTGSILTWIPAEILEQIGLSPEESKTFITINGDKIKRDIAVAICAVNGSKAGCNVVFGKSDDRTVLGVTALESMGLEVNPATGKLTPMDSMLAL